MNASEAPFMQESPVVSVIIPIYNSEQYLADTLDSVFNQTLQNFEIVAVDDGSPDNSAAVIKTYQKKYPGKIKYIKQENKGIAGARNTGIKNAKGEYIAFLDADDQWYPMRLQLAVELFEQNPEVALVHSNCDIMLPDGKVVPLKRTDDPAPEGMIFDKLVLRQATISCLSATFRRAVCSEIGYLDENRICMGVDDRDYWIRIAKNHPVGFISERLAMWRCHDNNYSSNIDKMFQGRFYVHKKLSLETFADRKLFLKGLYTIFKETADRYLIASQHQSAVRYYSKAIMVWPFNTWSYFGLVKSIFRVRPKRTFWKSDN